MKRILFIISMLFGVAYGQLCADEDTVRSNAVTLITANTARVNGTVSHFTGAPTSLQLRYVRVGQTDTATASSTPTSALRNLTGLQAGTAYYYYYKTICGSGTRSQTIGAYTFTTLANTIFYAPERPTIFNHVKVDSSMIIPAGDTVVGREPSTGAQIRYKTSNNTFYGYYPSCTCWRPLAIDSAGIIALLDGKVDSVTVSGDSLFYWKVGVSYGYILPATLLNNLTANLVYVDGTNGNDVTGTIGNESKPYQTLAAAKTDATTGYTIVVRPGTYTYDGTTLMKNGVNWYFMPGAIVSADATSNQSMFSDGGSTVSCKITGYGQFVDTSGGRGVILETTGSGSNIYFECYSMLAGYGDINQVLTIDAGVVTIDVRTTIECLNYDAIVQTGGTLNLTADKLLGSAAGGTEGSGFEMVGGSANIFCREIRTQGAHDAFGSSAAVVFGGGTAIIHSDIISDLADGLVLYTTTPGTLTIKGRVTSTSKTAVVYLTGTTNKTVTLDNTTLVSNTSFDGIDAPGAQTVISYNAAINKAVDANITVTGQALIANNVRFSGALMPNNTAGTSGQVLTSAGAGVVPTWTTPTSGANTSLSNLASVAINTSLLPGTDNSIDVGSGAKQWRYGIFGTGVSIGSAATPLAALDIRAADIFLTSSAVDQRFIIGEGLVSADQLYAISWNRTDNQLVFNEGGAAVSMRLEGDANANLFFADATNDRIGIGDATPASLFTVGSGDLFQVNTSGDLVKLKNVTYSWPAANAAGVLTNNGSGTLSWAAAFALTNGNGTTANGTAVDLGGTVGANVAIDEDGGNDNSFDIGRNTAFSDIRLGALNFTLNGGPVQMNNYGAGTATFDASGNITSVSDMRLKNLQGMYGVGLKQLMQVNPIVYKWNEKSKLETKHDYIGFSAQNVKDALGENAVGVNKDGYYSLQDRAILAAMVNSIKELKELNDNQQEQIKELKAEVKKLKKQ